MLTKNQKFIYLAHLLSEQHFDYSRWITNLVKLSQAQSAPENRPNNDWIPKSQTDIPPRPTDSMRSRGQLNRSTLSFETPCN